MRWRLRGRKGQFQVDRRADYLGALGAGGFGGGGFGGGGFGGGFGGGGFGPGGGGPGGFGGGRGNFRGFNPGQPHGAIFWTGSNSALNAEPFSLEGQPQEQPASGSNRFGITFMSAPVYSASDQAQRQGYDVSYAFRHAEFEPVRMSTRPFRRMRSEREIFPRQDLPAIYDPTTLQQFTSNGTANVIPAARISSQAAALLEYFPEPNLAPSGTDNNNYHLLTTAQTNTTQAGVRYMRSLGANATQPGGGRGGAGRRAQEHEPGAAAEHQLQLQLEPLGRGQREYLSAAGRQDLIGFELGAGRLHGGLSQGDEHLQRQLESQQQPDDELLYQRRGYCDPGWAFWGRTARR